mgnify:CR=1 FL=1
MTVDLVSLAIIALVAAACPIVAKLIPNKLVPETVFLLCLLYTSPSPRDCS